MEEYFFLSREASPELFSDTDSDVTLPPSSPRSVIRNIIPHITQIACLGCGGKTEFSTYILPKLPMDPGAEKATGIVFDGSYLVVKGQRVDAVPIKDELKNFISWISQFENVFLIAHSGRIFYFRVLSFALQNCGLQSKFTECVTRCVDSLTVIKHKFPKLNSYKQECLASHFGLPNYNALNAEDDVHMLHQIVSCYAE
ncbi:hypothetical protein FSP39_024616 [Pinctada imbricata]|uniref:Exonuclease domain-containing protein n=1 Tax=Pinctada imbricata TaxID=66713 RepID=A0AA88YG47_PINIB|nr:hypothetical protein FSP39_024616 [Pinctada imbricata]